MEKIKMNKSVVYILMAGTISLFMSSCDKDFEEINENQNNPEVVLTSNILNSATKELTDNSRDAFSSARTTLPWMQYWGQTSYADEDRYLYRETTASNLWRDYFRVANDFKAIIDFNENPETRSLMSSVGDNEGQIAVARIMLSYVFHQLVDSFGDVPYYSYGSDDPEFQALDVDGAITPVLADQRKVYLDILNELKEASITLSAIEVSVFSSGDNIFGGSAEKWSKFANSLILRVANRLRNVESSVATTAINEAIARGVFESNDDNAIQPYEQTDQNGSPLYRAFFVNNRTDFAVAAPFVNLLKGRELGFGLDPRLFQFAAPITATIGSIKDDSFADAAGNAVAENNADDYEGIPYAFPPINLIPFTTYSFPNSNVLRQDYGEVLMEYAEVAFILSEHNNWNQEQYENGVRASMERWEVDSDDVEAFVAGLPSASQENVLTQKYVALYMQPYEAWAEYRRTGFPKTLILPGDRAELASVQAATLPAGISPVYNFVPLVSGITDLPKRLRYPIVLQTLNGANRAAAVAKLGSDTVTESLFWDNN